MHISWRAEHTDAKPSFADKMEEWGRLAGKDKRLRAWVNRHPNTPAGKWTAGDRQTWSRYSPAPPPGIGLRSHQIRCCCNGFGLTFVGVRRDRGDKKVKLQVVFTGWELLTIAAASQGFSGKCCLFVTASDLLWTQPDRVSSNNSLAISLSVLESRLFAGTSGSVKFTVTTDNKVAK